MSYSTDVAAFVLAVNEERLDDALVAHRAAKASAKAEGRPGFPTFLAHLAAAAGASFRGNPSRSALDV